MRAVYRLAYILRRDVADILRMSAQDFARWDVWTRAEGIGPEYDRARYARQLAETANAPRFAKRDNAPYTAADFMPADPWRVEKPAHELTFEQIQAQASAMFGGP